MPASVPLPLVAVSCFMTALLFSLYGTPVAARAATRFGIVDRPDGSLKVHRRPVPYLGGLAVYVAFILTMALVFEFDQRVLGLLLAGAILVLLGLIDDFGVLGVWPKFLGQGFATVVLIKSDIAIHIASLPAWMNLSLTVIWIVGMTNAFNIIDIMDGLASGAALVAAAFLLVIAFLNGQTPIVLMTATLMGSLLGFLRYNRHPARIFMGDAGSLFIGMMMGALAMVGKYDRYNEIGYLTPLLILAVPIFDTVYVMSLRAMRGKNPFRGSPDHFALRLKRAGMPVPVIVSLTWGVGVLLGCLGLLNLRLDPSRSILLVGGVAISLIILGIVLSRVRPASASEKAPAEQAPRIEAERPAVQPARSEVASMRQR